MKNAIWSAWWLLIATSWFINLGMAGATGMIAWHTGSGVAQAVFWGVLLALNTTSILGWWKN